ncbi:phosphatase PAP2 family protein [Anaerovorax odorimutans]|uniref:Phosphatase PAP2 family protein n=1 Tax=Anaerovorax odorimutans TaxID=109327 RepID=A0ABT1RK26_9FIRM|nr:phosphatase PAP2 family protein [Anaerovorax odorimutans]MCQ4635532.1 phosphatase PAP2 family protein [Anaerovorax odorimutans]
MEELFKNKRDLLIFAGILLAYAFYLISVHIPMERHVIHVPLDDMIPFCEIFVIPYIWWYGFISGPLVWFFIKSREDFLDLGIYLLMGMWICSAFFLIYPTSIDFLPQEFPRNNLFTFLIKLLYAADNPANVFPSIHCFESTAICIAIWKSKRWGKFPKPRAVGLASAVLICLSTVFIKQHSVLDLAAGVLLALILYFPVYKINWPYRKRFE